MTSSKALVALLLSASVLVASAALVFEMRQSRKLQLRDQGAFPAPIDNRADNVLKGDSNPAKCAGSPMITPNADGTFTVQKEPPNGNCKDAKGKSGLVIPRQVVVPFFRVPERKR